MALRSDDPFYFIDREREAAEKERQRRARYRGFRSVEHFLELAEDRGPNRDVDREYRIIFMGEGLETLPFPVIEDDVA